MGEFVEGRLMYRKLVKDIKQFGKGAIIALRFLAGLNVNPEQSWGFAMNRT